MSTRGALNIASLRSSVARASLLPRSHRHLTGHHNRLAHRSAESARIWKLALTKLVAKAKIEVKWMVKKDKEEEQALLDDANEALKLVPRGRPLSSQSQEVIIASLDGGKTGTGYADAKFKDIEPTQKNKRAKKSSEDNKEEEEVEELCHDLFKDFAPTQKNKRAKKSSEDSKEEEPTRKKKRAKKSPSTEPKRQDEALARLALYVISCGGKRDSLEGWSAGRNKSGKWNYFSKEGNWFTSHREVGRWLELPGALVQRTIENIASPEECKEALENLASYVISRGGKRDSLEGWSARRDTSRIWRYSKKGNIRFKCRPVV